MNGYLTAVVDVTDVQTVWMRVAMAMLHSLWIGAAIGVFALISVLALRAARRRARYNVLVVSLLLIAASPLLVFFALAPEATTKTFDSLALRAPVEVPGRLVFTKPAEQPIADEATGTATFREPIKVVDEAGTAYVVPEVVPGENAANDLTPVIHEDALATRQRIVVSPKWIVLAYAAIACALLLRLAIGIAGGSRLRRTSQLVTDGAVLSALARHTQSLGMRITPAIAYCARVAVPTVVGVVRPMILLPLSAATGMTPEQVEYLVLHELAHIQRYDHIVNLLQRVIEALLFYHPVVWLISRQIRIEREHCCDDVVVRLGGDAQHYAESLLAAATLAQGFNVRNAVPSLRATGKTSHLRQRIARILGEPAPAVRLQHTGWVFALLCAFAGIVAIAQLDSSEGPELSKEPVNHGIERNKLGTLSVAATPSSADVSESAVRTFKLQPPKRHETRKENTTEPVQAVDAPIGQPSEFDQIRAEIGAWLREIPSIRDVKTSVAKSDGGSYISVEIALRSFADPRKFQVLLETLDGQITTGMQTETAAAAANSLSDDPIRFEVLPSEVKEIDEDDMGTELVTIVETIGGVKDATYQWNDSGDGKKQLLLTIHPKYEDSVESIEDDIKNLQLIDSIKYEFLSRPVDGEKFKQLASGLSQMFAKPVSQNAIAIPERDDSTLSQIAMQLEKVDQLLERNEKVPSKPIDEFDIERLVNADPAVASLAASIADAASDRTTDPPTDDGADAALDKAKQSARTKVVLSLQAQYRDWLNREVQNRNYVELVAQLQDKDWWLRKLAIQQLVEAKRADAWRSIVPLLKDEDPRVQAAAATALGQLKDSQSIKHLVAVLKEIPKSDGKPSEVVNAAALALTQFDQEQVLPILRLAATDEDLQVRGGAVAALARMESREVTDVLILAARGIPDERNGIQNHDVFSAMCRNIAEGLNKGDREYTIQQLGTLAQDGNPDVRLAYCKVLSYSYPMKEKMSERDSAQGTLIADARVVPTLLQLIKDQDAGVRFKAADLLGRHARFSEKSSDEIVAVLKKSLDDPEITVDSISADALTKLGVAPENDSQRAIFSFAQNGWNGMAAFGSVATPYMLRAFERYGGEDENLTQAMGKVKDPAIVDALIRGLSNPNENSLRNIIDALGAIGDARAADSIAPYLAHRSGKVADAATDAMIAFHDVRTMEACIKALKFYDENRFAKSLDALVAMPDARASSALAEIFWAYAKGTNGIANSMLPALTKRNDPAISAEIEKRIQTEPLDQFVAEASIPFLAEHPTPTTADTLIAIVTDQTPNLVPQKATAIKALGTMKAAKAIGPLSDLFRSSEIFPSYTAEALTRIGTAEAYDALRGAYLAASSQKFGVALRTEIPRALIKADSDSAREVLAWFVDRKALDDEMKPSVYYHLAEHGNEKAKVALDELRGANDVAQVRALEKSSTGGTTGDAESKPKDEANRELDKLFGAPNAPTVEVNPSADQQPEGAATAQETNVPLLQFRLVLEGAEAEGKTRVAAPTSDDPNETLALSNDIWITEKDLAAAVAGRHEQTGKPSVIFGLKPDAGERLKKLTGDNKGKRLAILYKGKLVLAPQLDAAISRTCEFYGNLTEKEAEEIAALVGRASQESRQERSNAGDDSPAKEQLADPILDKNVAVEPLPERILYDKGYVGDF